MACSVLMFGWWTFHSMEAVTKSKGTAALWYRVCKKSCTLEQLEDMTCVWCTML